MEKNELTYAIIGSVYKVHSELGPGLLESTYEACLKQELIETGLHVEHQKALPLVYRDIKLEVGYRMDLVVNGSVLVEVKAVDLIAPIHKAQVMTYLKLSGLKIGLMFNFNVVDMKTGISRIVM
ncbi:MAG: GxxExxY protein [Flavobacteriales bacterium]|nr:GxxExxY protein [Flavobacteriales bacterium]